jgi:CHASE1-domain containing sensor protein
MDIFLLFLGFLAVLFTGTALILTIRDGRRRLAALRSPQAVRRRIEALDDYLRRVDQAATEDELDRLEREREQ